MPFPEMVPIDEEIVRLSALFQRFARDDVVGVLHDEALSGLPEYLVETDRRHQPGADDLAEDIARADVILCRTS